MNIPTLSLQWIRSSPSARLLLLTIIFVMIGEVLIYVPSVAQFRVSYLEERIATARLASLSFDMLPARAIPDALHRKLLSQSNSYNFVLRLPNRSIFVSGLAEIPPVTESFDIRDPSFIEIMNDAVQIGLAAAPDHGSILSTNDCQLGRLGPHGRWDKSGAPESCTQGGDAPYSGRPCQTWAWGG